MLTPEKQIEITKRSMDAAFGYARAAINAAAESNARTLRVWTHVAEVLLPKPAPTMDTWEWSGEAKRPHSTLLAAEQEMRTAQNPFAAWSDVMEASRRIYFKAPPSPWAWWAWTPQSAVPATWPWAYGMISSGVPESVAWPMAEANVALLDAAQKTAEATQPSFPSYQSANGFSAQVWMGSPVVKSLLAALPATTLMWPWLNRVA